MFLTGCERICDPLVPQAILSSPCLGSSGVERGAGNGVGRGNAVRQSSLCNNLAIQPTRMTGPAGPRPDGPLIYPAIAVWRAAYSEVLFKEDERFRRAVIQPRRSTRAAHQIKDGATR